MVRGLGMIRAIKSIQSQSGEAGFSLIELAILMVIAGLLVSSALSTFDTYQKRTALNSTIEKRNNIEIALGRFVAEYGRLPCPANAALAVTDSNSGIENCRPGGLAYPDLSPSDCSGHCRIEGARKYFSTTNGVPETPGLSKDRVLRGVVPYKTLGLALWEAYDGWGTMMTYAVTELLSSSFLLSPDDPPPYGRINFKKDIVTGETPGSANGAIDVATWDEALGADDPAPYPGTQTIFSFPFVIVSHGPDRRGGWTVNGAVAIPCAGEGRDLVNCNPQGSSFVDPAYVVMRAGDLYYDDAVLSYAYVSSSDKWYYSGVGAIRNKEGKVGIDIEDPQTALDVEGSVRVAAARTAKFCDEAGDNCFDPGIIGGSTGLSCGTGAFMRGVSDETPDCAVGINLGSITPGVCAPGKFLVGFCVDGSMLCRAPADPEPVCP